MQTFHNRNSSLLFLECCIEQSLQKTVKLRIALVGIYRGLVCHRQKHLESGSGKATVVFVGGGWLLGVYFCISLNTGASCYT